MKNRLIFVSIVAIITGGILTACSSNENKAEASQGYKDSLTMANNAASDTINTAKDDWEKFKADANDRIQRNEDSIVVVKKRIAKEDTKIKAKYNKLVVRLEDKNNELKARLTDYKDEGKDKLEKFRADFNNSMDTLGTNIKDFFKGDKR
jgi:hypothetical protein